MTPFDTSGYYTVVDTPDAATTLDDYIEGRIFLNQETLVCGAGEVDGHGATVDDYSGSSIRMFFGKKYDPQQFEYETAQTRDETITVEVDEITDVKIIKWNKNENKRSKETYGVLLSVPSALNGELIIQLGKGSRNRGVGKNRHVAFAKALIDRNATESLETKSTDPTSESKNESSPIAQSYTSTKSEISSSSGEPSEQTDSAGQASVEQSVQEEAADTDSEPQSINDEPDNTTGADVESIKTDEATDSISSHKYGRGSLLPLGLIFIAVCLVVAIPFSDVLPFVGSFPMKGKLIIVALPTPTAIFVGLAMEFGTAPAMTNPSKLALAMMGIAIPAALIIDLLYVRKNTKWNPNRFLYPIGIVLIWPITLALYLLRRGKSTNQ